MKMKKFFVSALAIVMLFSCMSVPALASNDFSDLPATHWAYADVMKATEAGYFEGTGNNKFSPAVTLGADQFVTLIGRVCYKDEIKSQAGDNWSAPYIRAAKEKGILTGTSLTDATMTKGISRYDMAVILTNAGKLLGATGGAASSSQINDFGDIPTKYVDAVLWAYGNGLLKGDEKDNFNGTKTLSRAEAATVISRLMTLQENTKNTVVTPPEEETGEVWWDTDTSDIEIWGSSADGSLHRVLFWGNLKKTSDSAKIKQPGIEVSVYTTVDGTKLATTTTDEDGIWVFDIILPDKYYLPFDETLILKSEGTIDGKKYNNYYTADEYHAKSIAEFAMKHALGSTPKDSLGITLRMDEISN